jgi:muramoyltetrapeptide carboxypeptidase LdcA involved in peptidoglycan recycling
VNLIFNKTSTRFFIQISVSISSLASLPIIANCDFGHTTPILTLPSAAVAG